MNLEARVEELFGAELTAERRREALGVFEEFKGALNRGEVRAASREAGGRWVVHPWVKRGILLGFRLGGIADYSIDGNFRFFDKETYPTKRLRAEDGVRVVP